MANHDLRPERPAQVQPIPHDLHVGGPVAFQRRIVEAQEGHRAVLQRSIHPPRLPDLGTLAKHVFGPDVLGLTVPISPAKGEVSGNTTTAFGIVQLGVFELVRMPARDIADGTRGLCQHPPLKLRPSKKAEAGDDGCDDGSDDGSDDGDSGGGDDDVDDDAPLTHFRLLCPVHSCMSDWACPGIGA